MQHRQEKKEQGAERCDFLAEVVRCGTLQKKYRRDSTRRTARRLLLIVRKQVLFSKGILYQATLPTKNDILSR